MCFSSGASSLLHVCLLLVRAARRKEGHLLVLMENNSSGASRGQRTFNVVFLVEHPSVSLEQNLESRVSVSCFLLHLLHSSLKWPRRLILHQIGLSLWERLTDEPVLPVLSFFCKFLEPCIFTPFAAKPDEVLSFQVYASVNVNKIFNLRFNLMGLGSVKFYKMCMQ